MRRWPQGVVALAALLAAVDPQAPGAASPEPVRGVAPEEQAKYAPTVDGSGAPAFRCFSGTSAAPLLPFAVVNDDACDCADGSDEPGTSACAGQLQTLFFCRNEQSEAAYIYASRVNDGICDCCDGSDEWQSAAARSPICKDTCREEGRVLSKERSRKEADLRRGIEQRKTLLAAAASEKRKLEAELARLTEDRPALQAREREAKAELDKAEKAPKPAPTPPSEASSATEEEDGDHEEAPQEAEAEKEAEEEAAQAQEEEAAHAEAEEPAATAAAADSGPVVSEYAKWMEGAGQAETQGSQAPTPPPEGEAVVSEYAKWMEGADTALQGEAKAAEEETPPEEAKAAEEPPPVAPSPPTQAAPAPAPEAEAGFLARQWRKVTSAVRRLWHREPPQPLDIAREAHKDAKSKLKKNEERTEEIKKKLGRMTDDNDAMAYSGLDGRCLSKKVGEYDYKVCFFQKATQDGNSGTSIGTFKRWETAGVALFEEGDMCPGGPERSLKVRFQCGAKEELLEVGEPSRCAYEASAQHPAACTEEQLRALSARRPRRPTEEL